MTGVESATQRLNRWILAAAAVLLVAAIKTPPLYHSNQNTKFLHGLAQAFPDRLGGDPPKALLQAYAVADVVRETPFAVDPAGGPFLSPVFTGRDGMVLHVDRSGL